MCLSCREPKSGTITSTPRCSSRRNAMPASTTMHRPSASYTVMFFPTSPRPPRGNTRNTSAIGRSLGMKPRAVAPNGGVSGRDEQAEPLETPADGGDLLGRRRRDRQAMAADGVTEQVERGLDGDRVRLDLQQLVRRVELAVELARPDAVAAVEGANLLGDLEPDDVGVDADTAEAADLEERQDQVVVARVE